MYAMCYVTCFDLGFRVVCVCVCGGIQVGMGERIQVGMGPLGISHNRSWGGGGLSRAGLDRGMGLLPLDTNAPQ